MIYLDNAATTRVSPEAAAAMLPYYTEHFGNASAIYSLGGESKAAISRARSQVAGVIGARDSEIFFTCGGTEADNWALKATMEAYAAKGRHLITSKIEHHAILHSCQWLENHGCEITYLDVDKDGRVNPQDVQEAIRPDTVMVSVMTANNEIGTIEPVRQIGQICHERGVLFHTDAVQAFGQIPLNVDSMNMDMLSASAHKLHGPKGVGCLFIRRGLKVGPFIHGGGQERARRAGTENVPGIVGFGLAAQKASETLEEKMHYEAKLRDHLIHRVLTEISGVRLNGHPQERLPGNANFSFEGIDGESLLILLDMAGICASAGSACTSGSLDPSHVLTAIGLEHDRAMASLRLTLCEENTQEEIDYTVDRLKEIVQRLRDGHRN